MAQNGRLLHITNLVAIRSRADMLPPPAPYQSDANGPTAVISQVEKRFRDFWKD
jgi:hypothetical protein